MTIFGSLAGNLIAFTFFIFFQLCGIIISCALLRKEKLLPRLLAGSVFGSVLLHWIPTICSLILDFNIVSHIIAAVVVAVVAAVVLAKVKPLPSFTEIKGEASSIKFSPTIFVTLPIYIVFAVLVTGSFEFRDGAVWSGQATFGDTSMHLGFITSIAAQGTFPPDYSILPGTKLAYPFLSDSISSSLLIFGSSLKFAYCLPMYFAGMQVMGGFWLLIKTWLRDRAKVLLSWVLFFLCGGFGFVYFLSGTLENPVNFTRIFTAFYETPTNLIAENIRWVNIIVDMLLPQRATLFGWAVLMSALYFLYKAAWEKASSYFPIVAVLAAALPMIHTHSFVSLAFVSAGWLLMFLFKGTGSAGISAGVKVSFAFTLVLMQMLQIFFKERESDVYLVFLSIYGVIFAAVLIFALIKYIAKNKVSSQLCGWGVYLVITLLLALPQLFTWTFHQASGENFIRGYFNWANINDNFLWFYIKNLGLTFLMFVPGLISASKKNTLVAFPILIIWVISELAVFQPNVYDNNKFLYVAFIFICGIAADYMVDIYRRIKTVPGSRIIATCTLFVCTISALLTIGREFNAEYELIGADQLRAAEYILENTDPEDIILTDQRHNNAVAALTGRNILCGSPSYLYYHGLDYGLTAVDQQMLFEHPKEYRHIFDKYSIDYVMVSSYERSSYAVNESELVSLFPCVYAAGDVVIYKVN